MKRILIALFALLALTSVSLAQDTTAPVASFFPQDVFTIVVFIIASFLAGGVTIGVLATRLKQDANTIAAIERLGDSVPSEVATQLISALQTFKSLAELVEEALDKVPAKDKPTV
jgi:hypothetical protein